MARKVKDYPGILDGFEKAIADIQKTASEVPNNTLQGMVEGMVVIMGDTEKTSPVTPVDTGNLRASRFIIHSKASVLSGSNYERKSLGSDVFDGKQASFSDENKDKEKLQEEHKTTTGVISNEVAYSKDPMVVGGFSAYYAPLVHEIEMTKSGAKKNWKRPGSGIKFFEVSIKRNYQKVIDIIKKRSYR